MKHCRFLFLALTITILVSPIRFTPASLAGRW
jgi:hypothetical protein